MKTTIMTYTKMNGKETVKQLANGAVRMEVRTAPVHEEPVIEKPAEKVLHIDTSFIGMVNGHHDRKQIEVDHFLKHSKIENRKYRRQHPVETLVSRLGNLFN
jgi:hypothetical protein